MGDYDYRKSVANYTSRELTHDSDSLNAFRGIVAYLCKTSFSQGFVWGMPLHDFPQALRWYHSHKIIPQRRQAFPSWSWVGWCGEVVYSEPLDLSTVNGVIGTDMTVQFVSIDDQTLTVEGYVIKLDINKMSTPFSMALEHGSDVQLGLVHERDFPHIFHFTTIPPGTFDFLVVERKLYKDVAHEALRSEVHMIMLDWDGDFAIRRTFVRIILNLGVEFAQSHRTRRLQMR
jgi:hypothetical protein